MLTEVAGLLEVAHEQYRLVQDAEVECADGADMGLYWSRLYLARKELAGIARQLTRAQAGLVHHADRRANAARQVIGWCDDADAENHYPAVAA